MGIRKVVCPQCSGESIWATSNAYRPFCSERCKLIDLGAWASESYRVPVQGAVDSVSEENSAMPDETDRFSQ